MSRTSRGTRTLAAVALCIGAVTAPGAAAASPTGPGPQAQVQKVGGEARTLAGHVFVPSNLAVWPFVTTHFATTTGAGLARYGRDGQDEEGNPVDSLMLGAFGESFDLGIGFTDWIGIQARFGGQLLAGANLPSALSAGAFFMTQVEGGLVGRIFQGGGFHLAARMGGSYLNGKRLQPLDMIQTDEAGNLSIDRKRLMTKVKGWGVGPALMAAYAPASWFGMQTSFAFDYGKLTMADITVDNKALRWALGVNFDGRDLFLPIAIPVVYQLERVLEEEGKLEHRTESGLYYSGRQNLNLGLNVATKIGGEDQEYLGEFRMAYYW